LLKDEASIYDILVEGARRQLDKKVIMVPSGNINKQLT